MKSFYWYVLMTVVLSNTLLDDMSTPRITCFNKICLCGASVCSRCMFKHIDDILCLSLSLSYTATQLVLMLPYILFPDLSVEKYIPVIILWIL